MANKSAVLTVLKDMDERPRDMARSLRKFHRAERVLSDDHPRLIDRYSDQWVAVSDGAVIAHGTDLNKVLRQVDNKGVPRSDIIVRFIERTQRTLIL